MAYFFGKCRVLYVRLLHSESSVLVRVFQLLANGFISLERTHTNLWSKLSRITEKLSKTTKRPLRLHHHNTQIRQWYHVNRSFSEDFLYLWTWFDVVSRNIMYNRWQKRCIKSFEMIWNNIIIDLTTFWSSHEMRRIEFFKTSPKCCKAIGMGKISLGI